MKEKRERIEQKRQKKDNSGQENIETGSEKKLKESD
jgi:hypothetical protein